MMENPRPLPKIFSTCLIEGSNESEDRFEKAAHFLHTTINGLSEKETHDALITAVARGPNVHEDVSIGFLHRILTDPPTAARSFRDITLIARDGLQFVVGNVSILLGKKFHRLSDTSRVQIVWLLKEMMRSNVSGVDNLVAMMLRHLCGGDLSERNVSLIGIVLDALMECRAWLEKSPVTVALVVSTYLRLLEDHIGPGLEVLRVKEASFVVSLLRERFQDCLWIGRDLVRLLQNVARIPQIEAFWKELLNSPSTIQPNFPGVTHLLQIRTPRRVLMTRISPDMEEKLVFIANKVEFGHQKRYEDWFSTKYLSSPESSTLVSDLIRYIVGVIHPTNEQLCSNLIPRWAIILWLLHTNRSMISGSNARLALFYDFLFFQTDQDNIMNIEPAILLLLNTVKPNPMFCASMLDYLCRISVNFMPWAADFVTAGISNSFRHILEKRVVPSLDFLLANPSLDRTLLASLMEYFGEFFTTEKTVPAPAGIVPSEPEDPGLNGTKTQESTPSPTFSDDEDEKRQDGSEESESDEDAKEKKVKEDPGVPEGSSELLVSLSRFKHLPVVETRSVVGDISHLLSKIDDTLRNKMMKLRKLLKQMRVETLDEEARDEAKDEACAVVRELVFCLCDKWERGREEMAEPLAASLCAVLGDQLEGPLLPENPTEENLQKSISLPIFAVFEIISEMGKEDHKRQPVINLLAEMYSVRVAVGYRLLYYLKVKRKDLGEGCWGVYRDMCRGLQADLQISLQRDVEFCQDEDPDLFVWLMPELYKAYQDQALPSCDIMRMFLSLLDYPRLHHLISDVMRSEVRFLKPNTVAKMVSASYDWDQWVQACLWQLILAHNFSIATLVNCLPLPKKQCSVAAVHLLSMVRNTEPTQEMVSRVLACPVTCDNSPVQSEFVLTVLSHWEDCCGRQVSGYVAAVLTNLASNAASMSPSKRKRGSGPGGKNAVPTLDSALSHLCTFSRERGPRTQVLGSDEVMVALRAVEEVCSAEQKKDFLEVLSKAHGYAPKAVRGSGKGGGRGGGAGRKAGSNRSKSKVKKLSTSEEEESEDEGPTLKPKRRRQQQITSDSD
ncbi:unnamed protein product [Notodromas monacha]|uniref:SOSS complex subunit A homolog n=1 Tax=Notodromas monacha TaxID=399045 RepID=A0A7R9BQ51_9CRUS|nr:unnamed protein product [Notodromas monacha]CAG0919621.1 unnamed protein product [Notodromas monacha]